ncbi:MAG: hypothetical protein M0C28_07080 [Candidatus Moduliflexus flocculans]|nr:hypothetical protein [Candidatus Moduliflexus flocculans]
MARRQNADRTIAATWAASAGARRPGSAPRRPGRRGPSVRVAHVRRGHRLSPGPARSRPGP